MYVQHSVCATCVMCVPVRTHVCVDVVDASACVCMHVRLCVCNIDDVDFVYILMLADASRYFSCICAIFTCLVFRFAPAHIVCRWALAASFRANATVSLVLTQSFAQRIVSIRLAHRQTILQTRLWCEAVILIELHWLCASQRKTETDLLLSKHR